jgi:hypothetical protein
MSSFAELDQNKKVIRVLSCDNNDPNGDEGYQWLLDNLGGTWVKTSYNGNIRYNYAGIGYTYDADADAFIPPRPECGHKELFLNDSFIWNCQRCKLDIRAKELADAKEL